MMFSSEKRSDSGSSDNLRRVITDYKCCSLLEKDPSIIFQESVLRCTKTLLNFLYITDVRLVDDRANCDVMHNSIFLIPVK